MAVKYEIENVLGKWVVKRTGIIGYKFVVDEVVVKNCADELAAFAIALENIRKATLDCDDE